MNGNSWNIHTDVKLFCLLKLPLYIGRVHANTQISEAALPRAAFSTRRPPSFNRSIFFFPCCKARTFFNIILKGQESREPKPSNFGGNLTPHQIQKLGTGGLTYSYIILKGGCWCLAYSVLSSPSYISAQWKLTHLHGHAYRPIVPIVMLGRLHFDFRHKKDSGLSALLPEQSATHSSIFSAFASRCYQVSSNKS